MYQKLTRYPQFVQDCDRKFNWAAVYSYDLKFRNKVASSSFPFNFDEVDHMLYTTILDATAVKPSLVQCFRCKGTDHVVQQCPFPHWRKLKKRKGQCLQRKLKNGTTKGRKVVITSSKESVHSQTVSVPMCVASVGDQTPSVSVNNVIKFNNSKSPLHYCAWENGLKTHPDQDFVKTLLDGIKYGVNVGYTGPRSYRENPNWPSAIKNRDAIEKAIQKDLMLGRKLAPSLYLLVKTLLVPLWVLLKKRRSLGKYRVIHDLSWPPGSSINEFISKSDHSMQYISIDNLVQKVVAKGHKCLMAKLDIEDAFKHIIVRPEDVELLGTTWTRQLADGGQIKEYYLDLLLPFLMRSSPKLFNDYGLEFIMKASGSSEVLHYLDDYFTCGQAGTKECRENLDIMNSVYSLPRWNLQQLALKYYVSWLIQT